MAWTPGNFKVISRAGLRTNRASAFCSWSFQSWEEERVPCRRTRKISSGAVFLVNFLRYWLLGDCFQNQPISRIRRERASFHLFFCSGLRNNLQQSVQLFDHFINCTNRCACKHKKLCTRSRSLSHGATFAWHSHSKACLCGTGNALLYLLFRFLCENVRRLAMCHIPSIHSRNLSPLIAQPLARSARVTVTLRPLVNVSWTVSCFCWSRAIFFRCQQVTCSEQLDMADADATPRSTTT